MAQKLDEAAERYRRADAECRKAMADLGDALDALGVGSLFVPVLDKLAEIAREERRDGECGN